MRSEALHYERLASCSITHQKAARCRGLLCKCWLICLVWSKTIKQGKTGHAERRWCERIVRRCAEDSVSYVKLSTQPNRRQCIITPLWLRQCHIHCGNVVMHATHQTHELYCTCPVYRVQKGLLTNRPNFGFFNERRVPLKLLEKSHLLQILLPSLPSSCRPWGRNTGGWGRVGLGRV